MSRQLLREDRRITDSQPRNSVHFQVFVETASVVSVEAERHGTYRMVQHFCVVAHPFGQLLVIVAIRVWERWKIGVIRPERSNQSDGNGRGRQVSASHRKVFDHEAALLNDSLRRQRFSLCDLCAELEPPDKQRHVVVVLVRQEPCIEFGLDKHVATDNLDSSTTLGTKKERCDAVIITDARRDRWRKRSMFRKQQSSADDLNIRLV